MYAKNVGVLPTAKPYKKPSKLEISAALRFCRKFVSKITSYSDRDLRNELIQEGICSFLKAYKNFDKSLGYSVLTYTATHMKGDMLRAWNKYKSPVNITFTKENLHTLYNLSGNSKNEIENQRRDHFRDMMNSRDIDDLLDETAYANPYLSSHTFMDEMVDNDLKSRLGKLIDELKQSLSECELDVLENRLLGHHGLAEIAARYNMSAEGIRKKEARILKMIKLKFKDGRIGN